MTKRKAMNSQKAREVRQKGHDDALEFALAIGLTSDYKNDKQAKKDVIDLSGDSHSVKSGVKRWQIFLYHKSRFENDSAFLTMNGIGQILINILELFPDDFNDYKLNKQLYKEKLRSYMIELKNKLTEKSRLKTFLEKSFFNGNEVNYLTVKEDGYYHIFYNKDVVNALSSNCIIENSQARKGNETPEQKVLLKYNNTNLGEIEVRNSSPNHYREILFVVNKKKILELLFNNIRNKIKFNDKVFMYGTATKKFGNWVKNK